MKIVIVGPGYPLRGGISASNHRLAEAFIAEGHACRIVSFSMQYPDFLFPGKSQFYDEPQTDEIEVKSWIHSTHPLNWKKIGKRIGKEKPDLVIFRFWMPFFGLCFGNIARQIQKNKHSKILCLCDNAIPHEERIGDKFLSRYFFKKCDGFMAMSKQVKEDLKSLNVKQPIQLLYHPIYDNFGSIVLQKQAREYLGLHPERKIFLFFGLIRKYKGLDWLIEALAIYKNQSKQPFQLLIAGEFYEEEDKYTTLIEKLDLQNEIKIFNQFIPNHEVKYYMCAADLLIQPYKSATQSGVTPLGYHFEIPMLVTNVGGLGDQIPENIGKVVAPDIESIAKGLLEMNQASLSHYKASIKEEKKNYSWDVFVDKTIGFVKKLSS